MAITLEELKTKIEQVEQTLAEVRQQLDRLSGEEPPVPRKKGAKEWLEKYRRENEALRPLAEKVLRQMGIQGEPIPAQDLRKRMMEEGIRPEDNEFSRAIIEMREE